MKKRRLKRWVKNLMAYVLLFSICMIFVMTMSYRAEQVDKSMEVNYEEIN